MSNDEKDSGQEANNLFFKWIVILIFSLFIFIDIGIYQKEITNFYYLILIIILVAIASEKFDEIKIGNVIELKKIRKEFNKKTDEIMKEIKQIQSQGQFQDQKQNQNQNQTQKLEQQSSIESNNSLNNSPTINLIIAPNSPSSLNIYKSAKEDNKTFNNSNNLIR